MSSFPQMKKTLLILEKPKISTVHICLKAVAIVTHKQVLTGERLGTGYGTGTSTGPSAVSNAFPNSTGHKINNLNFEKISRFETYMIVKSYIGAVVISLHCKQDMFTYISVSHKHTAKHCIISQFHTYIKSPAPN